MSFAWWEWLFAVISALFGAATSFYSIKAIIKHEEELCEKRLAAFREGLDRGEKGH